MKYLKVLISSIMAGFSIAFGATFYLVLASQGIFWLKVLGSFLFGIGLFTIIHFDFWLYTGKVGYIFENKPNYLLKLLISFIGNLIGVIGISFLIKQTYVINDNIISFCQNLVSIKDHERWFEVSILSFLCGMMIYLAVEGHKRASYPLVKVIFAFIPISLFIICGFEHVIANACYYTYAGSLNWHEILWFIYMGLGNALGSLAFYGMEKLIKLFSKKEEAI